MLILPRYNDIFGYFTAISLYQESRYNDTLIKRSKSTAPLAYRYIGVPLYCFQFIELSRGRLLNTANDHDKKRIKKNFPHVALICACRIT